MENNPREVIGGNNPPLARMISGEEDFSATVTAWLEDEFRGSPTAVVALLEEARNLPETIDDDETKSRYTSLIKRIRDESKRLESFHEKEKTPYLRGGQAIDQFFFGLIDKMVRRSKTGRPGAADILNASLTDYDVRKLRQEQERRAKLAAETARIAKEAQEKAAREAQEAEERRLAETRARKPEAKEERAQEAATAAETASAAKVEAEVATGRAQEARFDTFAKPADIMRQRGDDGTLSTMATEAYAEIADESKLERDKLWPFISTEAKAKALRAWAKNTGFEVQMAGAAIGRKPKSVVR